MAETHNPASDARKSIHTEERILCAAERLFVDHGYVATLLRVITAEAKVNLAAVHYHFGSKEALIREVFERRLGPQNAPRIAYLDRLETATRGRPLAIEQDHAGHRGTGIARQQRASGAKGRISAVAR